MRTEYVAPPKSEKKDSLVDDIKDVPDDSFENQDNGDNVVLEDKKVDNSDNVQDKDAFEEFDKQDEENKKRELELKNGPAPSFNVGISVGFNDDTHAEQAKKQDEQRTEFEDWGIDPTGKVTLDTKNPMADDESPKKEEIDLKEDLKHNKSGDQSPENEGDLDEDELEELRLSKLREAG